MTTQEIKSAMENGLFPHFTATHQKLVETGVWHEYQNGVSKNADIVVYLNLDADIVNGGYIEGSAYGTDKESIELFVEEAQAVGAKIEI